MAKCSVIMASSHTEIVSGMQSYHYSLDKEVFVL